MASKTVRLVRLLDRGFYPAELPPPFRTRRYSDIKGTFSPPNNYSGSTTFFDGATFRGTLRTFGIINPVNYLLLSVHIAQHWTSIASVFALSSCSGARPKFPALAAEGRGITTTSLSAKRRSQSHLAGMYPVILSLDINRFYGSIYTHSIPWAVLGKEEAKKQLRAKTLAGHWSDVLDRLVRNCNQQQTVGIAIGPDTSRIVSELILSRIDAEVTAPGSVLFSSQIHHNIDDYQIGCIDIGEAENAQSGFAKTISRYELRLNDFKTSMQHGLSFAPSIFKRHFDFLDQLNGGSFIERFFETLYIQAEKHPDENVIGYALKRFARKLARSDERELIKEYLQRLMFAAPHQGRWILPLLLGRCLVDGVSADVRRVLFWAISTCARRNDVGSLLWYLYAAIFLKVQLSSNLVVQCHGVGSELVDLMLMHGRSMGLFPVKISDFRKRYTNADFNSSAWITLYEVQRRGWDSSADGFFQQNVVSEYTHENAIADKVNVGNEVFLIETEISQTGGKLQAQQLIEKRERQTRARRWETQEDEAAYAATQLDRSVVAPDQIRTVIQTFRDQWPAIFPGRKELPKTLIFAKTDSHADDIIQMVRTEFGQGNEFCRKITNGAKNPKSTLSAFRNEYYPRIAVTVDMIATGTDVNRHSPSGLPLDFKIA